MRTAKWLPLTLDSNKNRLPQARPVEPLLQWQRLSCLRSYLSGRRLRKARRYLCIINVPNELYILSQIGRPKESRSGVAVRYTTNQASVLLTQIIGFTHN
jgi:hypothetical protein